MSTIDARREGGASTGLTAPTRGSARWVVSDALVMTRRNLLQYVRVPELLLFSSIQPVMFVLLFAYVFGGAIQVPNGNYLDFLMPGIFVQTVVFGSTVTGVALAEDLSKGMIDRFRSLPMSRSAVLAGRTLADLTRNVFVVLLMTAVGYLIGFRFHGTILEAVAALAIVALFGFAISWLSATMGLLIKDVEATQAASFIPIFPLTFASSAFVPVESMPDWLQTFVKVNPVTITVDGVRRLVLGTADAGAVVGPLIWIAVILAIFAPLAVRIYRRS